MLSQVSAQVPLVKVDRTAQERFRGCFNEAMTTEELIGQQVLFVNSDTTAPDQAATLDWKRIVVGKLLSSL
jgi:hypothetical protein